MPEYAELHLTAHVVSDAARGHAFKRAEVDTTWSLPCSLPPLDKEGNLHPVETRCTLPGTRKWEHGFEICSRHRGKEVCLALRPLAKADTCQLSTAPTWCPTCSAVADDGDGDRPPLCSGHHEPCVRQTVRREGAKHIGHKFWSCARDKARDRCSFFQWASAKAADWFPASPPPSSLSAVESAECESDGMLLLTLRRGMHGRCVLLRSDEDVPKGAHLRFVRADGSVLAFIDARVRVSHDAIWQFGLWGGPYRRSPDPLYEYSAFRARALSLLDAAAPPVRDANAVLDAPVCEFLLDQRICNGVGNCMRALDAHACVHAHARASLDGPAARVPANWRSRAPQQHARP